MIAWARRFGKVWLAIGLKWTFFCLGLGVSWEEMPWLFFRIGPVLLDISYGKKPGWAK